MDLVIGNVHLQVFVALGIQVVCKYCAALFRSRQSEGANTSENICDDIVGRKTIN